MSSVRENISFEAPFILPDNRVANGTAPPINVAPLLNGASAVLGVVHGLSRDGLQILRARGTKAKTRLVIAVYPACPTSAETLLELASSQSSRSRDEEYRIFIAPDIWQGTPSSSLYVVRSEESPLLLHGAMGDFWSEGRRSDQASLVLSPDALLRNAWRKWFEYLWTQSAPLTSATIRIPALQPAKGSEEAARQWELYALACKSAMNEADEELEVSVDDETGEVIAFRGSSEEEPPTKYIDIPRLPPIAERVAKLFEKGWLVTIDESSRTPPLEVPLDAEWFGVDSLTRTGSVRRETKYRLTAFEESDRKRLEKYLKATRSLLSQMSFSLGRGIAWMPFPVWTLFEHELDRQKIESREFLDTLLRGDPDAFVEAQRARVERDANRMYSEFRPGSSLSPDVIDEMLDALRTRVAKALSGSILPQVTRAMMNVDAPIETDHLTWGQGLSLVSQIALYPREAVASGQYFTRGLDVEPHELLEAMDICQDAYVQQCLRAWPSYEEGKREVARVKEILDADFEPLDKCQRLLALMKEKQESDPHLVEVP